MAFQIAWASIYLQFSSFSFLCSGLFGDILCLRFFLSWAYIWLLVNAVTGFPSLFEIWKKPDEVFVLHIDTLIWTVLTLYTHASKFTGIVLNERNVEKDIPDEAMPLWRMLYRNSGLSQLLFQQFIYPSKFQLVHFQAGSRIPTDDYLYIILDGVASTNVTLETSSSHGDDEPQQTQQVLHLSSGEVINVKLLHLFRQGAECEAFANQTVDSTCITDVTLYRIHASDIRSMAMQPQTKQAFQGLLIFALTNVAERAILDVHRGVNVNNYKRRVGPDGRDPAFYKLEPWEEPQPIHSGSGRALTIPIQHFTYSLHKSFRPPWPISRWMPGLRHAALPAPHLLPIVVVGRKNHDDGSTARPKRTASYGTSVTTITATTTTSVSSSGTTSHAVDEEVRDEEESNYVGEESRPLL